MHAWQKNKFFIIVKEETKMDQHNIISKVPSFKKKNIIK